MKARKALLEAVRLCRNEPMFEALLGSDQSSLGRAVRQDVYHAAVRAKCEPAIRALKKAGVDHSGVVSEEVIPECETMEADHRLPFLGGRRWREVPRWLGLPQPARVNPFPHPYP